MTRKALNTNWKERDRLVFRDKEPPYMGGCAWYKNLDAPTLRQMIALGYADPEETQNESPEISEFADLLEQHPGLTAHGYVVSFERDDYRMSVEGVEGIIHGTEPLIELLIKYRFADEFEIESTNGGFNVRLWWD